MGLSTACFGACWIFSGISPSGSKLPGGTFVVPSDGSLAASTGILPGGSRELELSTMRFCDACSAPKPSSTGGTPQVTVSSCGCSCGAWSASQSCSPGGAWQGLIPPSVHGAPSLSPAGLLSHPFSASRGLGIDDWAHISTLLSFPP